MGLIKMVYYHKLQRGWEGVFDDRVDVWNVDPATGEKSTWEGALIKSPSGEIREIGTVPPELRRNLELMLIGT